MKKGKTGALGAVGAGRDEEKMMESRMSADKPVGPTARGVQARGEWLASALFADVDNEGEDCDWLAQLTRSGKPT